MSKAFTREGDDDGETELPPYVAPWPPGARNYISAEGYARLRDEHDALVSELPSLSKTAKVEARRRLAQLAVHLDAAEIVTPRADPTHVQLGATVTVHGERERTYTIVGVDDVDVARGRISWLSPIARALTGAKVGDVVVLRSPKGEDEVEIVSIS